MKKSALIPAYTEEDRIFEVINETKNYVDEVLVIDDGSSDGTAKVSEEAGAEVIIHEENEGYMEALRTGFKNIGEGVVITLDADGEMDPGYIPDLSEPIEKGEADLVLGSREYVPRKSERVLSRLAGFSVDVSDTGTGFRALRIGLARKMELRGLCPCGTFVLEAKKLDAKIREVPVESRSVNKPKRIAWKHFFQFWHVIKALLSL